MGLESERPNAITSNLRHRLSLLASLHETYVRAPQCQYAKLASQAHLFLQPRMKLTSASSAPINAITSNLCPVLLPRQTVENSFLDARCGVTGQSEAEKKTEEKKKRIKEKKKTTKGKKLNKGVESTSFEGVMKSN